jgi:hypothetical protein
LTPRTVVGRTLKAVVFFRPGFRLTKVFPKKRRIAFALATLTPLLITFPRVRRKPGVAATASKVTETLLESKFRTRDPAPGRVNRRIQDHIGIVVRVRICLGMSACVLGIGFGKCLCRDIVG